jgi:hypothetical protein
MTASDEVKKELNNLLESKDILLKFCVEQDIVNFGNEYQCWYSRAYKIVDALAPERLAEFISYYLIDPKRKTFNSSVYVLQDYITGRLATKNHAGKPVFDIHNAAVIRVINQFQILNSLSSRIDTVLQDVTGHLFAELQDAELQAASRLKKDSIRAAGALAGVVLERHLQRVAMNHKISISKKNPTIADLNDPMKNANIYDLPTWRKIQYLTDLRNECCHQKEIEPTEEKVNELITEVNKIVKNIF